MRVAFQDSVVGQVESAEFTPDELFALLTTYQFGPCTPMTCVGKKCPHKYVGLWGPIELLPGATTRKHNVRNVTGFTADLDSTTDLSCIGRIQTEGIRGFIHSTHSHTAAAASLRLFLFLDKPVPVARWKSTWKGIVSHYGIPADPACKDAERMYFLPTAPIGTEPFCFLLSGNSFLESEKFFIPEPQHESGPAPIQANPPANITPDAIVEQLVPAWPQKGRHRASLALAAALTRDGWDEDLATYILTEIGRKVNGDDGEPQKRRRQVQDSKSKLESGEEVTGYNSLVTEHGIHSDIIDHVRGKFTPTELAQIRYAMGFRGLLDDFQLGNIAHRGSPAVRLHTTGTKELDDLTGGGFATRSIWTTIAPPGAGKSAWMVNAALAVEAEAPVLIITTELDAAEYMHRFVGRIERLPWRDLTTGKMKVETQALNTKRIYIIEHDDLPLDPIKAMEFIETKIEQISSKFDLPPVLMLDYFQDFAARANPIDIRLGAVQMSRAFKALAKQRDCAVVLVSSTSRGFYGKGNEQALRDSDEPEVYLAAAKESGWIESDSTVVMYIDRERQSGHARFAVAKARRGVAGFVGMQFDGASGTWHSNPKALELLSLESRAERKATVKSEKEEAEIIKFLQAQHGKSTSKNRIVQALKAQPSQYGPGGKLGRNAVEEAITRLIEKGLIVATTDGANAGITLVG